MSGPRFERIRTLGSGASGTVDLCRLLAPFGDLPSGGEVAVKVLDPSLRADPAARAALRAEAETARRVEDASLVRVLYHGVGEEGPFLVLQYVPGRSLREILEEDGRLPEPLVRSVGAQLAGALAALHAADIVHGDVKPENVRLDDGGRAVLLDLGFAVHGRVADGGGSASRAGSLAYLSPERAAGGEPSEEADVFALGLVLYEIATETHPFGFVAERAGHRVPRALFGMTSSSGSLVRRSIEEPGADNLLAAITAGRFELPSRIVPQLSPFLDAVLAECLSRSPGLRPTAGALRDRLSAAESGPWWRARIDRPPREGPLPKRTRSRRWLVPLLGRDTELEVLGKAWLEVCGAAEAPGHSEVVAVEGAAGCGKWRLVKEFVARARETPHPPLHLYARCEEASDTRPGGSLLLLLHRWLQLPPGTPPGAREEELLRGLVVPSASRTLLATLGRPEERVALESVPTALATWLAALGRRQPVVVFLDDLHRAGAVSLDTLSVLIGALSGTRILLLLGARDDAEAAQPVLLAHLRRRLERLAEAKSPPHFRVLRLGPLPPEAMRDLVEGLFHPSTPRRRLERVLWSRSHGNPGLVVEILRDLLERGAAHPRSDGDPRLVLTLAPDEIPRPRSLEGIVAERFARLEPGERLWLERMAVVGTRIDPAFLAAAFPPTRRAEIDAVLASLVRSAWLVSAANRYRFERPALREALLRSLPPGRRARLHRAAARGLDSPQARPSERFQRIYHLRAAGEREAVVREVHALLGEIRGHASARRLYTLARWGLEALEAAPRGPEVDRQRLALLEVAADAADRLGHREEQRQLLDHLADHELDAERQPAEGARLYLLHARYASGTAQFGLARGMLRNALQLAGRAEERMLRSEAARRLAQVQGQIGEFGEARELAERALLTATDADQTALAHLTVSLLDTLEDRVEAALREVDRALEAVGRRAAAQLGVVAQAQLQRGRVLRATGRLGAAQAAMARAVSLARRAGERVLACEARARLGGLLADLDRTEEAETQLHEAMLVAGEIEDRRTEVLGGIFLGALLFENGDDSGRGSLERGTNLAGEIGFHRAEAVGLALLARVLREAGDLEAAEEGSRRAKELLDRHGGELVDHILIEGTRALLLHEIHRTTEAKVYVRQVRRRMRRSNRAIRADRLRRTHRVYTTRLLETVLSSEGPVFPRSRSPVPPPALP